MHTDSRRQACAPISRDSDCQSCLLFTATLQSVYFILIRHHGPAEVRPLTSLQKEAERRHQLWIVVLTDVHLADHPPQPGTDLVHTCVKKAPLLCPVPLTAYERPLWYTMVFSTTQHSNSLCVGFVWRHGWVAVPELQSLFS